MNLIKKLISKKTNHLDEDILIHLGHLPQTINLIKTNLTSLANHRRKDQFELRMQVIRAIGLYLITVKEDLINFNKYIIRLQNRYNNSVADKDKTKQELDSLNSKKKELRAEFESIYNNFKRISTGLRYKDIPMKQILRQMRISFNFDGTLLNENNKITYYYDSGFMTII